MIRRRIINIQVPMNSQRSSVGGGNEEVVDTMDNATRGGEGMTVTAAGDEGRDDENKVAGAAYTTSTATATAADATTASSRRHNNLIMEELTMDSQTLEDRKRNVLVHALSLRGGGGGDGGGDENSDNKNKKPQQRSSGRASAASTTATSEAAASSSLLPDALSTAKSTTVAAALSARPQPNYPPASELIFGTGGKRPRTEATSSASTTATIAASSSASVVVGDGTNEPPPKRKAGRPRKLLVAADTTTTTNVARKLSLSSTTTTDANAGATIVPTATKAAAATNSATATSTLSTTTAAAVVAAAAAPKRKVGRPRKPISHPPSRPNSRGSIHDDTTNKNITTDNNRTANHASYYTNNDDVDNTVVDTNECYAKNHYDANYASTATTSSTSLPPSSSTSNLLQPQTSSTSSPYYDDEYARFMRSIIGDEEDDDRSILTFKTLQSIRTTTTDNNNNQGENEAGSAVFENTTLDEDDFSYQLTSEGEEEEEEDDDEDEDEMDEIEEDEGEKAMQSPPRGSSTMQSSSTLSSPTLTLDDDEDLLNVLGEIEDLMEEDLEFAAMASLIGGSGFDAMAGAGGGGGGGGGANDDLGGPSSRVGGGTSRETNAVGTIVGTLQKQMAVTTPGVSTKKKKSTTTVVTTPPQCTSRDRQAAAASANNNSNVNSSLGIVGVGGIDVSPVTKGQLARLRRMMAHHHQLLLQQATLSVRAAYVQKVRKDGLSSNTASTAASEGTRRSLLLPESRLETKSLNFISKPVASECSYVNDFFGGETPDELSECLDGSVGMLQDLEQNWKDAVRKSIQLPPHSAPVVTVSSLTHVSGARKLKLGESESSSSANNNANINVGVGNPSESNHDRNSSRRLTRSALTKTLLERDLESVHDKIASPAKKYPPSSSSTSTSTAANAPCRISVFDIRGLSRLKAAFSALDNSVKDVVMGREKGKNEDGINVLAPDTHGKACEILLKHARAEIDMKCLPGGQDLGACLTHAPEAFDEPDKVQYPLTKQQEAELRRNRHTFTAGEDNLILRGVNLYGEKEWCLVSDRFLPDRVFNSISQRYNKLCFLIYKANGIVLDDKGKLPPIPHFAKGATYDVAKAETLTPARAPTTMNVHRWTLEEDIAILKAAPIMGNFWAEIGARLLPHRDRGHIRKRFQVLQRRIPKGVTKMNMNYLKRPIEHPMKSSKSPKRTKVVVPKAAAPRPPATKKEVTKNKPSQPPARKQPSVAPPSPAHILHQGIQVPAVAEESSPTSSSPARIFQLADQARKQRPPMSPIDSAPPSKTVQPFSSRGSPQALFQAVETIQSSCIDGPSPETKIVASVLGGFSQSSHNMDENSQMHVEKILGDEWSQASRMGRLILAGNAESNFVGGRLTDCDGTVQSGQVGEMLPAYQIPYGDEASRLSVINDEHQTDSEAQRRGQVNHGERKSILSSVMEKTNKNASKRKNTTTAFLSTPTKVPSNLHEANSCAVSDEYHSSSIHPTTINLSTPAKEARSVLDATQGETTMNQEFFEYFMSDKSRGGEEGSMMPDGGDVPSVDNMEMIFSPAKTNTMMMMSPIKIGKMSTTTSTTMMTASTPLSQFGTIGSISGPLDGENSLFMHASVFDAASALKDLSTSTPNTPSKLLRSRDDFEEEADDVEGAQYHHNDAAGLGDIKGEDADEGWTSKSSFPKTSFFGKVKARLSSDNADERKSG